MTNSEEPRLIRGAAAIDDRGAVGFVNEFGFAGVKRFYTVTNHRAGFVRAWHGHKLEAKYCTATSGALLVCAVRIDDWGDPSPDLPIHRFVLADQTPSVLYIPAGFANGFMSLSDGAKVMIFSTATLEESQHDDFRFHARRWDPWTVEER